MTLGDIRAAPPTTGRGNIWLAAIVMFVLSLLLGWIPVIGSLVAGVIGGTLAKSVGSALLAALIPAIAVGLLIALVSSALGLPLLIGAAIGGWMSSSRRTAK